MTGSHVVFLELRRASRVTTGNSGCLLCWPRQVQSSIRVAKESWALLSSDCRANRPHLGLCPEANVPLQGRQGSRGCIPDAPGETGIHLEWKQRTPLCSRMATGISWSSLGGLKGVKPPEAFGERSRVWSLGHAGDEGPHLPMTGESRGCSRAAAPVCGFSRGTTARSVSLSWGAREVGSPRSEEHTSELQSPLNLVCRLLLEKKKKNKDYINIDRKKNERGQATEGKKQY